MNIVKWLALAGLVLSLPMTAAAQLRLITEEEAKAPNLPVPLLRAITRGPSVKMLTPSEVTGRSFPLKIVMEARGGAAVDPQSFRVEYLKQPPVDLTERVRGALQGNTLDLPEVMVPAGRHPLRVTVRDSEGREGRLTVQLIAR